MSRVRVLSSTVTGGRVERLTVELLGLGKREIDRATAVAWLKDGHTFVPVVGGREGRALHLVEGPDEQHYIRTNGDAVAEDVLPG